MAGVMKGLLRAHVMINLEEACFDGHVLSAYGVLMSGESRHA